MRSLFLAGFLSLATFCTSFAQSSLKDSQFNFGLETSIFFGKKDTRLVNSGFGGTLKYEYRADSNFYFTISAGYTNFPLNELGKQEYALAGMPRSSIGYIPFKIGGKFYIVKGLFGEVQLGNAFGVNIHRLESASASVFTFSPGIGYAFNNGLELGARYEGWFTSTLANQCVFRVAYRFKL